MKKYQFIETESTFMETNYDSKPCNALHYEFIRIVLCNGMDF